MIASRLGRTFGLALCLWACSASAERVVVLELKGDRGGRVRSQVEQALLEAGRVELVPLKQYKAAAARQGLKGARAMAGAGVAQLASELRLEVAVGGSVEGAFRVQLLDAGGQELWSRELPLSHGMIGQENVRKLAAAIAVAARPRAQAEAPPGPATPEPSGPGGATAPPPAPEDSAQPDETGAGSPESSPGPPSVEVPGPAAPAPPAPVAEGQKAPSGPLPPVLTVQLGGISTWRSYCARPGVSRCAAYDQLVTQGPPPGETAQFNTSVPYQGGSLAVDLFPLASFEGPLQGLGLSALYSRAWSKSSITVSTPSTHTQPKAVVSVDQWVQALAVYRLFFAVGSGRLVGYLGARGGAAYRGFTVDPTALVPLPGAQRLHGLLGLEAALPLWRWLRLEAAVSWFPGAMPGARELGAYGDTATGSGWGAEGGLAGELWGPLGYSVLLRYSAYTDLFKGAGAAWPNGGVAQESYATLAWSLTARF